MKVEFEFSNGAKGTLKPVPILLRTHHVYKSFPPPVPPEGNYQDENYRLARADWQARREAFLRKVYLEIGVEIKVPAGEVKAYRENMRKTLDLELDGSDKFVYLSCICIRDSQEWNRLLEQILALGEENVEAS